MMLEKATASELAKRDQLKRDAGKVIDLLRTLFAGKGFNRQVDDYTASAWILAMGAISCTLEEFRAMVGEFLLDADPNPPTPGVFMAAVKASRRSSVSEAILEQVAEDARQEQEQRSNEWCMRHFGHTEPTREQIRAKLAELDEQADAAMRERTQLMRRDSNLDPEKLAAIKKRFEELSSEKQRGKR